MTKTLLLGVFMLRSTVATAEHERPRLCIANRSECEMVVIAEAGSGFKRYSRYPTVIADDVYASAELGLLYNLSLTDGVGVSLGAATTGAAGNNYIPVLMRGRYRRWFGRYMADVSLGLLLGGDHVSERIEVAIGAADNIALIAGIDFVHEGSYLTEQNLAIRFNGFASIPGALLAFGMWAKSLDSN